ncbi:YceI family protein [Paracoccus sp. (in: a-proteobacteria)]|uniref:YceI family protein n=1 Tax=Paracoccus sp. TaxID=267 RepID=UPI00289F05B4|nr:YceI family protein [Paracoccus sp. (in: a-proteobacteria)]
MKSTLIALTTAAGLLAMPAFAEDVAPAAGTYNFDPDHSAAVFHYKHMGFSTSTGIARGITGTIVLDPAEPAKSTVEASFPISNILTVSAQLDEHMRGKDLFNSPDGSQMVTFKSTKVEVDDEDEAKITGDLTLNGVTKEVVLDVDLTKAGTNPMSGKPAVGFDAETKIKRSDFNLGIFAPAVDDEVKIDISVEAAKAD